MDRQLSDRQVLHPKDASPRRGGPTETATPQSLVGGVVVPDDPESWELELLLPVLLAAMADVANDTAKPHGET